MQTQVARWGNSLALRIPKPVADALALADGTRVEIDTVDGHLVVRPLTPAPTLEQLLAAITPGNLPEDGFDDAPRGRELL
jgi:antitoxin MazE